MTFHFPRCLFVRPLFNSEFEVQSSVLFCSASVAQVHDCLQSKLPFHESFLRILLLQDEKEEESFENRTSELREFKELWQTNPGKEILPRSNIAAQKLSAFHLERQRQDEQFEFRFTSCATPSKFSNFRKVASLTITEWVRCSFQLRLRKTAPSSPSSFVRAANQR